MFDKSFPLPDIAPVVLTGADAVRFAQAQFMNDVVALPVGQWQWNGWLTPKGRVVALFALVKRAEDEVLLLLLDADPAAFCAALSRFVFRSKVKVLPCPALAVLGCFAAPKQARGSLLAELDDGVLELDVGAEGGARTLLLKAPLPPGEGVGKRRLRAIGSRRFRTPGVLRRAGLGRGSGESNEGITAWQRFDLTHGLPRLLPGQTEHWTPQQLSLDRLNAYSVKKGCYPGQEIVARTHFLGQAKRGLVRLVAEHAITPEAGAQVNEGSPLPLVACSGHEALTVLALDTAPDAQIRIGAQPAGRQPLLGGLAR